jgi:hypothetical protein
MSKKFWIIMGDVVGSQATNQKELGKSLTTLIKEVNQHFQDAIISPLTVTLGDEFQGVVTNESAGKSIIIWSEEWLLKEQLNYKMRYVLHHGTIATPINKKIAHGMMGEGLTVARQSLEKMKSEKIRYKVLGTEKDETINKIWVLFQSVSDDWKPKDRNLVIDFLTLQDYKQVGEKNKKTTSQMWKREKSLKIKEYNIIKELLLSGCNG